jgi:hypothetical protein
MIKKKDQPVSIRIKDLEDVITRPKAESQVVRQEVKTTRYDAEGKSELELGKKLKDSEACAFVAKSGLHSVFKIKSARGGELYNPSKHGRSGLTSVNKNNNDPMFVYREVNVQAFEAYLKFLQTGYDSYLLIAERETKNGR